MKKVSENRRDAHLVCLPYWEAILEPCSIHENANQTWSPLVPTNAVFILGGFFLFVFFCFAFTGEPAVSRNSGASELIYCDCEVPALP